GDRRMVADYVDDRTGAIEHVQRDGKYYVVIKQFAKMREGGSMLLKESMRIEAEGDYDAIKALVDKYGTHFDPAVRDQVVARYKALNLPTYWAGVYAELTANTGKNGEVASVEISYPRDAVRQYLNYGAMYDAGLKKQSALSKQHSAR